MLPEFWHRLDASLQWLLLLVEVVVVVAALGHVILRKPDPRAAAFWAVIIAFVPLFGGILYGIFGINSLRRRGREYRTSSPLGRDRVAGKVPANQFQRVPELTSLRGLATTLSRLSRYEFTVGNCITVLRNGDEAMPAMIEAIRQAKTSVTLGSYIFEATGIGESFLEELVAARHRGVQVRVMVDDAGTRYSWPPVTRLLRSEGVRAARYMPHRFLLRILTMNLRNHRKILVVDGKVGFTGGMNIRQGNMLSQNPPHPVRDMHFKVEGPVVRQLQQAFAEDWAFCAGEILEGDTWYPHIDPMGEVAAIGVPDGPDEDMEVMPQAIFAALNAARRQILVMTPYFLPDNQLIWALNMAALRGVDVRIITPKFNNIPPVRWAARTLYPMLLEKGVKIYESSGPFDHTKFMTVDGIWSLIGSTNWDPRSLRLNFEFNLACFDEALTSQMNAQFEKNLAQSDLVTIKELAEAPLAARLRNGLARMFIPML